MDGEKKTGFLDKLLKNPRNTKIIVAAGVIGAALILISTFIPDKSNKSAESKSSETDGQSYTVALEEQLKGLVSRITGSKNVSVFLTLEGGAQYIYASEKKETSEKNGETQKSAAEEKYVIVKNGSEEEPVLLAEISPQIKGVVIVCSGSEQTKAAVKEAVMTALCLPSMKVCVLLVNS
jgi:stage III sporulation protein AG